MVSSSNSKRSVISGIVTDCRGATSHAAVVSREIGRPCVVGCGAGVLEALAGREITVDGASGRVWPGRVAAAADLPLDPRLVRLAGWAAELLDDEQRAGVASRAPAESVVAVVDVLSATR